jgi:hypothetical protein
MSARPVPSWSGRAAGPCAAALCRLCRRISRDDAKGLSQTGGRRVTRNTETPGIRREVYGGSALGPGPNPALQRIAARWRR